MSIKFANGRELVLNGREATLDDPATAVPDQRRLDMERRLAIEGMQPQINDMERRLGIMQSVEPVLENAIKTLQKVVDVRGMAKKEEDETQKEAEPKALCTCDCHKHL